MLECTWPVAYLPQEERLERMQRGKNKKIYRIVLFEETTSSKIFFIAAFTVHGTQSDT